MTDDDFRKLCNTFGFAPSRALREMIDCVRAQEIEACAGVCFWEAAFVPDLIDRERIQQCAAAIRARKENT